MLFAVTYTYRASASEATVKRLNTLFGNWQPPKGYEIKVHYSYADGTYTRMAGSAPAFKWLKITPGKDF